MPYNYYSKSRYLNNIGNITEALYSMQKRGSKVSREEFVESITKGNSLIDS